MKHLHRVKYVIVLVLAGVSVFLTYKYLNRAPDIESIHSFDVAMSVQKNKEILVTETVVYDFGYNKKQGISRYIPLNSADGRRLNISVLSVVDEFGEAYKYETPVVDDVLAIKTGDPDNLLKGIRTYKISYKVEHAVTAYKKFNEIYWNVTGDEWPSEIKSATASITLPGRVGVQKMACVTGPRASTEKNCTFSSSETNETTNVLFSITRPLTAKEGLTILLDFSLDI